MSTKTDLAAGTVILGNGAQFWAYVSPSSDTAKWVTKWSVTIQQQNGNWAGTITSDDPTQMLQTPNLSGIFNVTVSASGPNFPWQQLQPQSGSSAQIGCNSNCAGMVGIVATPGGTGANFWTVWNAICGPTRS
ncbi:MAG TPA: hypothetical protein VGF48_12250 [Thermoanaerobaculia bacterium]|jgi:hypothetical protein